MYLRFSHYSSLGLFHPLSPSWFCSVWAAQENAFIAHMAGSTRCLGALKGSLLFCLQFQQDIYTCKSIIASIPRSVDTTCPQIPLCWMFLWSQRLWPLPAVHPKPGCPAEWQALGLNLIPFCSSCILPIFGRAWAQEDYFPHPTVLCPTLCLFWRTRQRDRLLKELCRKM